MSKKTDPSKDLKNRIKELEEGWQRTQADFDNYRRRSESAKSEVLNLMKVDFMAKITPVLDNFRRAFEHSPDDNFAQGVKQIEKQLEDILVSEGLQKISAEKETKFDPSFHEAISYEKSDTPADHIIDQVETGWMFNDRVLKPAKVRVSSGE